MAIYLIVLMILEIIVIVLGKITKKEKYSEILDGLFFGFYALIVAYYLYSVLSIIFLFHFDSEKENLLLYTLIIHGFLSVLNLILGIIGFKIVKKKKINFSVLKKKGNTFTYFLIVIITGFINILSQDAVEYSKKIKTENQIKQETMIYLENKYGSKDFKIDYISRDFAMNGFVTTDYLDNYDIYATYLPDKIKIHIYLDVDASRNILINTFKDDLIYTLSEKYFKKNDFTYTFEQSKYEFNIYLKEKGLNATASQYSIIRYINSSDIAELVPNNYGKVPSRKELYDLILKYYSTHDLTISIRKEKSDDLRNDIITHLISISNSITDYYNGLDEYEINFSFYNENESFSSGTLKITKEFIIIDGVLEGNDLKENIKR